MNHEERILEILSVMQGDMSSMKDDIGSLKGDVAGLKTDVASLKEDVADLKEDMVTVKGDIVTMKGDIATLHNDVTKIHIKLETDIEVKIDALGDGHAALLEQMVPRCRVDDLENEVRFLKLVVTRMTDDIALLKKAQ